VAHSSPPKTKRLWVEYPAQRKMKSRRLNDVYGRVSLKDSLARFIYRADANQAAK
jgi:hypothetical protein